MSAASDSEPINELAAMLAGLDAQRARRWVELIELAAAIAPADRDAIIDEFFAYALIQRNNRDTKE